MAFTEGKQTQLGHGPYDPHPDKVDGGRPDDGVINSKEKQTDYMPIEEPPSPSHSEEINGPLNNSMPNKTSQMAVRIRSNEQPSFHQNVRQSGRGLRQSFYKRGGLPYIGENSEAVSSNRALGKPEMTERVSPADGEERPKKYPVATFARNSQIRNRPPNPVLTISRGPQPVILNLPSPVPGQTHDSIPVTNPAKEGNIRSMAMLGRSEDSLNAFTRDMLSQPSEARMNRQLKSASSRALSVSTLGESTDFSRADSWSFSRSQEPRLMSAYSSPTLNLQNASGAKTKMCESGNWNEAYDSPVFTQFALQSSSITERQEQEVNRYLAAYARGSLPKIPKDYIDDFPQGLARGKATFLDALADSSATQTSNPATVLTKGDPNKRCNQQRAIMELVQTEANYIKVLEMMIDVHVAVFLELNKPMTDASIPSRVGSYRSYHSSGGSMHKRRRDSLFEKIRPSNRRRIRSHAETGISLRASVTSINNGTFSETSSFQNFGSTNSLSSISAPQRPQPIPDVSDIFGNLGQIYRANVKFWEDCFEPCFSGSPPGEPKLTVKKLKAAFLKFETYFEPYVEYLKHCHSIISNVKTLEVKNRLFAAYTEWTTYHNTLHHRESLTSLLRKPFQRSMQYGLLLQRIKDETRDPEEICDLDEMLSVVNEFVKKIESGIPEHEERLELEKFLQRIEGYFYLKALPEGLHTYADSLADLKTRLRQPVSVAGQNKYRIPLTELTAKVKFSNGKIREAVCILLTDQILICKEMRKSNGLSVCRPPIPLSHAQLVSKSGLLAIIERGEWSYIKEIYTIIAESILLKAWSDQVRQAKRTLDLALEVPPTSSQSCCTALSESRTPGLSPMSSVHRFPVPTEADTRRTRTLPASTGLLGFHELPRTTVVKRPTVPLPKTVGRTAAEMSRTVSIPDNFQRQTSSLEDVACSSSGSISDSIGGQVTDSTSSRNNSLKSSGTNTSRGEERDETDGLCRSDFPVRTEVSVTVGSEKRKGVTSVV